MSVFPSVRQGIAVVCLLFSVFGRPAHAVVYSPDGEPGTQRDAASAAEPFRLPTSLLPDGPLRAKWQEVARAIEVEAQTVADCRLHPETCGSPAALRFLGIVRAASERTGLARLGEVNRALNLAIRPVSDLDQYGVEDHWSSPLATLSAGAGDCEDYAIAKLVALREAGVASDDLRLLIIRDSLTGEDHAVLAARHDGRWRLLDNRTFVMVEAAEPSKYRPLFVIDAEGVKRFEQTPIATAHAQQEASPASPATAKMGDSVPAVTSGIASHPEINGLDAVSLTLVM